VREMAEVYFLIMGFGVPLTLLIVAVLAGLLRRDGHPELDWKPTRSPKREAELELAEIHQMLGAQNRYRRLRGAPERSLEEISERTGTAIKR
jgi:hypothetical protein